MTALGKQCWMMGVAVKGDMSVESAERVVNAVISAIGMTKIYESKTWTYDGNLGLIYAQPLYESIVTADFWPRHRGGYLVVTSCREYDPRDVIRAAKESGYSVISKTPLCMMSIDDDTNLQN